jgi:long-chain acyl-CoA synthetase
MNLACAFGASAGKHHAEPALFWGEAQFTHGAILTECQRVAHYLQAFQLKPGERVGLWIKNCPEFIYSLLGVWFARGVVVPINNFLKPHEVEFILADAGIRLLITESALGDAFGRLRATKPDLQIIQVEQFAPLASVGSGLSVSPPESESDLALIIYTSGTTGHPKGAMLSHGNLLHNVESCRQVLQAVSFDRFVLLLPMFHSFMLTVGILLPLTVGGSIVLIKTLQSPKSVIQEALARDATILPAIPPFFRALANAPLPEPFSLRLCISGAAPLPREILREFNARFPIPLLEGYGLSEASPVVSLNPIRGPWKEGSIGVPIPNVEMSVQNDAGELLDVNCVGEICVRGGNVMHGYWNNPEETAKALRAGWLLTGDVGYRDADGYYYITDRKKDMLLVNGINVYPREIEELIYQFPGVKEAAVVGIPDSRKGEQPLAFVAIKDAHVLDERALLSFLKENLADYKVPRRVVCLPQLPRNATGKVLKTALRGMAT